MQLLIGHFSGGDYMLKHTFHCYYSKTIHYLPKENTMNLHNEWMTEPQALAI
jgi:hypothetical protein